MAIEEKIYKKGIDGKFTISEINSLPKDYEIFKGMFLEASVARLKGEKDNNKMKKINNDEI